MDRRAAARRPVLTTERERGSFAHYEDPAYYDEAYADRTNDVAFYVDVAL